MDKAEPKYLALEDFEKYLQNRPRIRKMWMPIRGRILQLTDFPYHIRRIKWFIQRGKRGYADCDWWNMHSYLTGIILPMLKRMKADQMGYPGYGRASTEKKWDVLLDEMIATFEIAKKIDDDMY